MKKALKLTALVLALVMLLSSLSGCGSPIGVMEPPAGLDPLVRKTSFFEDIWRGDLSYSDMEYEHYKAEWFEAYTGPILDLAENGGSEQDFKDANYDLIDELYYVYTLLELSDLKYSANPADGSAAAEQSYSQDLYYELNDQYWLALHELAVSPNADLLSSYYYDWQIEQFAAYEPPTDDDQQLYSSENELVRQYYTLIAEASPDYDALADLYAQLVAVRKNTASLYGYEDFAAYAYDYYYSKDYGPEDAQAVWQGAKEYFVPLLSAYAEKVYARSSDLYYSEEIDCSPEVILDSMRAPLGKMSSELLASFDYMLEYGLYDIAQDSAKTQTGYTATLYYWNEPFIFNCPAGSYYDYTDMFHEFGHFNNSFYIQSDLIFGVGDNDLAELQSQGMEVMFTKFCGDIFGEENGDAVRDDILLNLVYSVIDGALYDEFQQRVFAEQELTGERACQIYAELYEEYGYVPYDGYEYEWISIPHNFEYPFYYISYSVSAVAALELYQQMGEDWEAAVDRYLTVAAMDGELYYYSQALEEAGFADIFDQATFKTVAEALAESFK